MNRREVIRLVSLATGAAISAPLMGSLLTGCKTDKKTDLDYVLKFFNENEFNYISTIVDLILPKTNSPSATDVEVHKIIDSMLATVYKPHEKKAYRNTLSSLIKFLSDKNFLDLKADMQKEILQNLNNSSEAVKVGYLELKQQTIAYYLSTEEIGENHLNYLPVPGKYEPCITLEETGGKAWAI